MDHLLYTAMSGAKQIFYAQQSNANNLANAQTTGFKQDFAEARAMPVFGPGMPTRVYSMTERPSSDFKAGGIITTGRDLDIAIKKEDGFLAVMDKNGKESYTRNGELKVDETGLLTTATGHPVMGDGGPITLPPAKKIDIGADGTITVIPAGQDDTVTTIIGRLKLVTVDPQNTHKNNDGLFVTNDGKALPPDANVQVLSGSLEGSNVNVVASMTSMIDLSRQYEMQVKMLKTAKDMEDSSSQLLRAN